MGWLIVSWGPVGHHRMIGGLTKLADFTNPLIAEFGIWATGSRRSFIPSSRAVATAWHRLAVAMCGAWKVEHAQRTEIPFPIEIRQPA